MAATAAATAAATSRVENPEAALSQSQPSVPNTTANSENITQSPTVSASSTITQPPGNSSPVVGGETKVLEECTSSDGAAASLTEAQKKIRRSERFGVPVKLSEGDKRNSRAERFGSVVGANGSNATKKSEEQKTKKSEEQKTKKSEEQKKVARAERFGLVQTTPDDNEAKKKARRTPILVVDSVEEDKRKARAARFSQDQPASLSNTNNFG